MHGIEDELGRVRTVRNGPRTIDLDLIDFGGISLSEPELTLPHPRAKEREFVMRPLAELGIGLGEAAPGDVRPCRLRFRSAFCYNQPAPLIVQETPGAVKSRQG